MINTGERHKCAKVLDSLKEKSEISLTTQRGGFQMGRGRKKKSIKMKNRKGQAAKKARAKKRRESVRKARSS